MYICICICICIYTYIFFLLHNKFVYVHYIQSKRIKFCGIYEKVTNAKNYFNKYTVYYEYIKTNAMK